MLQILSIFHFGQHLYVSTVTPYEPKTENKVKPIHKNSTRGNARNIEPINANDRLANNIFRYNSGRFDVASNNPSVELFLLRTKEFSQLQRY